MGVVETLEGGSKDGHYQDALYTFVELKKNIAKGPFYSIKEGVKLILSTVYLMGKLQRHPQQCN